MLIKIVYNDQSGTDYYEVTSVEHDLDAFLVFQANPTLEMRFCKCACFVSTPQGWELVK